MKSVTFDNGRGFALGFDEAAPSPFVTWQFTETENGQKELVSLQRRCANNLNQVAVHANTFGVYPEEIAGLQRDYEKLWGRVSDVLTELSALVEK